ncbi:tripartite tricarboxylate transporter TctB family protein [Sporosarcina sp.]|uniref:tripartite tricarboxylate transporter TctB family protein n=1 Tax=Sporosarcina sp. TaxID=49982 RepID=UPI002606D8AE|nr:tripartite tricarboxylate transporter TctB family protein [Sporosarcina sp.]
MLRTMDRKVSLIIMALAIFYLILSYRLPKLAFTKVDADVLPLGLGYLLLGLAVILFIQNKPETEEQKERRKIKKEDLNLLLVTLAALILYVFCLEFLGFVITTIVFLSLTMRMYGYMNWMRNIIVSFVFTFVLYLSFNYLLKIFLPQGILPF